MRRVMYVFLPRWPIDRLRRSGSIPSLASASVDEPPFATVAASGGRRLLAALNPAAEKAGLAPGMPVPDALSFLPGLINVPADPASDSTALTRLAEWCGRYSPWTAPDDSDGIKIEITGSAHLWGGEAALAADLVRAIERLAEDLAARLAREGMGARRLALGFHRVDGRVEAVREESRPVEIRPLQAPQHRPRTRSSP